MRKGWNVHFEPWAEPKVRGMEDAQLQSPLAAGHSSLCAEKLVFEKPSRARFRKQPNVVNASIDFALLNPEK